MMPNFSINTLFHRDILAMTMTFLVSFIGIVVALFASRYMQGDSQYRRFFGLLCLLIMTLIVMVFADNLILFLLSWAVSNLMLVMLMIHKSKWRAALNAGLLTAKMLGLGFVSLSLAFFILYYQTRETSIQGILAHVNHTNPLTLVAMMFILMAAMTQSALWPFHRWLLSSLNSPTPVSAMMHAGLVNGGGFLLARFAPLYLSKPDVLTLIFFLGAITAFLGTLWKLMQHDVKRMLACSTMAQMGFMIAQCGLGLFPAAIGHLFWHGLFKANLFLSSNSAAKEQRFDVNKDLNFSKFSWAIVCGLMGSYFFSIAIHSLWLANNTMFILICLVFMTASQFSLSLLMNYSAWQQLPIIMIVTCVVAYLYGLNISIMEFIFRPMHFFQPQKINIIHVFSLVIFIAAWIIFLFKEKLFKVENLSRLRQILYMKSLNASQPHPSAITRHRNDYRY